jgi:hypothetical protein
MRINFVKYMLKNTHEWTGSAPCTIQSIPTKAGIQKMARILPITGIDLILNIV